MRIVSPYEITPTELASTNVINAEQDWVSGTYAIGDRAVYENIVYEAVVQTSDIPDVGAAADPPSWVRIGWSNQYRMFNDGVDSKSTNLGSIDVTVEFESLLSTVVILGVSGITARLIVTTVQEGIIYDKTIQITDIGAYDWWEYFFAPYSVVTDVIFNNIPSYSGTSSQLIIDAASPSDHAEIGRLLAGVEREIGTALYGTSISFQDYSIKERDGFGNLTLVKRRTIKEVHYDVHVNTSGVSDLVRTLQQIASVPTLFIGDDNMLATIVFGVYTDVSQGITTPSVSELTITVEEF